jgi:cytochrome c-type biogenesis protein
VGSTFAGIAANGPLLVAMGVAALAGLASFLSPCVLPLVPGYLSYVTGLAGADLNAGQRKGRVLAGIMLFIAGFAAVFVAVSIVAASATLALIANRRILEVIGGALIVVLGFAFMGLIPGLQREWRLHKLPAAGLVGAPVFGAVFALSWVPCTGPTLGAVLTLGMTSGSMPRAITLALAYCLGLGIPFLIFGLGFRRVIGVVRAVRRHSQWVTRVGGAMLVLVGALLITGVWWDFVVWLQSSVGPGSVPI